MTTTSTETPETVPTVRPAAENTKTMLAAEWRGRRDIRAAECPRPSAVDPHSALVRITTTAICPADLFLYHGEMPGLRKGNIFGHEGVGIVDSVGEQVSHVKIGDRVVVSSAIACGICFYCQQGKFSLCDHSNLPRETEENPGHRNSGLFGYSRIFGAYNGCQAEYVRVPYADLNLLQLPDNITDEKAIFLSDVLCASWHATELGGISDGKTVAIWGCDPVGLLAIKCAKLRGASTVVAIDDYPFRLKFAKEEMGADEVIDSSKEKDVTKKVLELIPGGPDVAIDCVGTRHRPSFFQKVEKVMRLDVESSEALNEAIAAVRKGGTVAITGDYHFKANYFPVATLVEKGVSLHTGQAFVQKYWKQLLDYMTENKIDPSRLITHTMPLEGAADAYRIFDKKQENALKVLLKPHHTIEKPKEEHVEASTSQQEHVPSPEPATVLEGSPPTSQTPTASTPPPNLPPSET